MQIGRVSKEMERKIFELTLALYRVTDFFPPEEILKRQLREKANDILSLVAEYGLGEESKNSVYTILAKIRSLKNYLGLAKYNRLVKPININVLEREYDFFESFFERRLDFWEEAVEDSYPKKKRATAIERDVIFRQKVSLENDNDRVGEENYAIPDNSPKIASMAKKTDNPFKSGLNQRQETIVKYIGSAGRAKISDFLDKFAGISSKTIQRDLNDLVVKNILKKEGEKRWTVYSLV